VRHIEAQRCERPDLLLDVLNSLDESMKLITRHRTWSAHGFLPVKTTERMLRVWALVQAETANVVTGALRREEQHKPFAPSGQSQRDCLQLIADTSRKLGHDVRDESLGPPPQERASSKAG
jgi:hypothetical protein